MRNSSNFMIRVVRRRVLLLAIAGAAGAAPGFAKDRAQAELEFQPIFASNLLAPAEPQAGRRTPRLSLIDVERAGLLEPPPYRLDREGDAVTGKRAKLSVPLGDTRVFAVSGKLIRRERLGPTDGVEASSANVLGPRKLESGRLYGGGLERKFGSVDVSAAYQYSRINGAQLDPTSNDAALRIDDKSQSHSVQLRARVRF